MPQRICFVCDAFLSDPKATITGPMVQTYLLGKEFKRRGWIVDYVVYSKEGKDGIVETYEGLNVHWIRHLRFLPLRNYWKVSRALAQINADYYYQRGRDILGGWTSDYCRKTRKMFLWASAGESGVDKNKYLTRLKRRKRPLHRLLLLWLEARINDGICNRGIANADRIIVQTVYQKERLRQTFGRESVVIKSGHPVPEKIERELPFKILWIGSIKKVKRPELFIELADLCKDLDCEFWMVGQIVDERFRSLIATASRRLPRFKYVGSVPFEKSQEIISKAHILVNTTDNGYEGLPNAFVQAWLAGTVTLSRYADPDGAITEQRTGYVQPDVAGFRQYLLQWTQNFADWDEISVKCQQFGRNHFSIHTVVDELEQTMTTEFMVRPQA